MFNVTLQICTYIVTADIGTKFFLYPQLSYLSGNVDISMCDSKSLHRFSSDQKIHKKD
jgi:hypothetical protein